jgi:drug/metabolite transporter (DMT)-like permease
VVGYFPPWLGAAGRLSIALVSLYLILQIRGVSVKAKWKVCGKLWGMGLLSIGIPFALLFWGEQKVPAGIAGIINGTVPIWTSLILLILPPRKIKPSLLGGVLLGFVGLLFIFYPKIKNSGGEAEFLSLLAILLMAFSYTASNLINQKILTRTEKLRVEAATFHQHLSSCAFVWILSILFETWTLSPWNGAALKASIAMVYLGVFPSALAFIIYFTLLKRIGALKTGAVTYLIPISALILDFLIQGQYPTPHALWGAAFVFAGLFFIRSG